MDHQDWKPVILKKNNSQLKKDGKIVKEKILSGKRPNSNSNNCDINKKKLDDDDVPAPTYVPKSICIEIQQARCARKMSQQDLANRLNVKKNIVNELESGKMIYNKGFIRKVKNILQIK